MASHLRRPFITGEVESVEAAEDEDEEEGDDEAKGVDDMAKGVDARAKGVHDILSQSK